MRRTHASAKSRRSNAKSKPTAQSPASSPASPRNGNPEAVRRAGDTASEQPVYAQPSRSSTASAEVLDALLDGIQEGVAHVSTEGVILYANTSFARLLGADPAEIEENKTQLLDLMTPNSAAELDAALKSAAREPVEGTVRFDDAQGPGPRAIRLVLTPVHWKTKTTIKVTAGEVTEVMQQRRELQEKEQSLRELSARIMQLQEEERRRIARDLHDITGQELAVVIMQLMQVARQQRADSEAMKGITDAASMVRKIEDEIRTLSYVLHPPLLDELGLGAALNWYVEGFTKRSGIDAKVEVQENLPRLAKEKELALFRVVQEGLTNVMRHSGSRTARIQVSSDANAVTLAIQDEGKGIPRRRFAGADSRSQGVGIVGMRERLQQLGGTLDVRPLPKGTEIVAVMPVGQAPPIETPVTEDDILQMAKSLGYKGSLSQPETSIAPLAAAQASGTQPPPTPSIAAPPRESGRKRILIADDHEITRQGIRTLLKDEADIEVCGEAKDAKDVVLKARELAPDLIIMDLSMPGGGGFAAAKVIRHSEMHAKILFFTTHQNREIERLARIAGFEGLVEKADAARDLIRGARAVFEGKRFYGGQVLSPEEASLPRPAKTGAAYA